MMQYRKLGTTRYDVSVVGTGCWAMGGPLTSWAQVDDNESISAIRQGFELGINLVETAPSYGYGHSEEVVGRAIASCRDNVILASKCGLVWREAGGRLDRCLKRDSVRKECEASLRRLRVEMIDLYQVQSPDPLTPIEQTMEALLALRDQGKIGAIGLSNLTCQQITEARRFGSIDVIQIELSLLEPQAVDELLPYCREYGIGVLACGCLARGLLTGKFDATSRFADVRSADGRFTSDAFRHNLDFVERLRPIAARHGCSVAQLALRWVLQQEGVTAVIPGAKQASQVRENAGAAALELAPADLDEIERILRERE